MARVRTAQANGLYKRCGCGPAKWVRCSCSWYVDFFYSRSAGPKKRYRFSLHKLAGKPASYVMPKSEAEALRDELRSQIRKGTFIDPSRPAHVTDVRMTVGDVLDVYLRQHVDVPGRRPTARQAMRWHVEQLRTITISVGRGQACRFGEIPIADVTRAHVESIREARREAGQRASIEREQWLKTAAERVLRGEPAGRPSYRLPGVKGGEVGINRLLARLRHVFSWAIEHGHIEATPFKRGTQTVVRLTSHVERPRARRLDIGEEARLLAAAGPHLRALIVAALETGCRLGELLSLQLSQVEYVEQAKDRAARWLMLPASKTKTGETRRVPVSTRLRAVIALRELAPDGKRHEPTAYLFGNEAGEQVKSIKTAWRATCRRAGIEGLHFHDLRREFGSRLLESGASEHIVRDFLGHADIGTTSRYLATTPVRLEAALRHMERLHSETAVPTFGASNEAVTAAS